MGGGVASGVLRVNNGGAGKCEHLGQSAQHISPETTQQPV